MDDMTLFISGSQSFIGRTLLDRCRNKGVNVVGIDTVPVSRPGLYTADIRNPDIADLIPEGATVVHLAAISRDQDCRNDPGLAFDVNVNGTINLAASAQKRKAAQFIFASSEWVYGDVGNDKIQFEDSPIDITRMKSEYAFTKIAGEQWLRLTCKIPGVTVLRFGIVYGPRVHNWSAVESLFNSVRTQEEVKIGSVKTARRFIHVDDIVSGLLASRGRSGFEIFNLSGDRPISLGEVVKTSEKILGRKVRLHETNANQPSIRNPDNSNARAKLKWEPSVGLDAGLKTLSRFLDSRTA